MILLAASVVFFVSMGAIFVVQHFARSKQYASDQDYTRLVVAHASEMEKNITGQIMENQIAFWGNDSSSRFPLAQLAAKERLFFYFTQNVCPPCLISTLELIKRYFIDYEYNDLIVFISPDWPSRLRNDCYGKKLLTFQNETLNLSLEKDVPFFFVLSPEMEITSAHIITKVNFDRTEAYLRKRYADQR